MCSIFFFFSPWAKSFSSENVIYAQIFFNPLQKIRSLYSSASAFFISRRLIPIEETGGQRRTLDAVPHLFSAFPVGTWHILLPPGI